ncbi:MAG: energy transducer TonB [Pyrinomonadaceae bacterium MAG19_C2-C3]|nr:energy transducer TonB [Pyrinomonadaceae bacterium MAG19_C2-C3]
MKIKRIQSITMFVVASMFLLSSGFAQNQNPSSSSVSQDKIGKASDEDKVYSPKEVDTKAVIKNQKELDPERLGAAIDCRNGARGVVKAVLRKSGEVTDIKVKIPALCSLDEKAAKIVSFAKFTPAIKDGVAVSQYIEIKYEFRRF